MVKFNNETFTGQATIEAGTPFFLTLQSFEGDQRVTAQQIDVGIQRVSGTGVPTLAEVSFRLVQTVAEELTYAFDSGVLQAGRYHIRLAGS